MKNWITLIACWLFCVFMPRSVLSLELTIDYRYDTNNFFDPTTTDGQLARAALEAVTERYSAIIAGPTLMAVDAIDDFDDVRIGFRHPGTGRDTQISSARSIASDALVEAGAPAADEYIGDFSISEDSWILFAGGRSLGGPIGIGGTSSATNFLNVFEDGNSIANRGFRETGTLDNLPVWGGSISFENAQTNWHFDHTVAAPASQVDFYSVALHEVGHALGLMTGWDEWIANMLSPTEFIGANAIAAYNSDHDASVSVLSLEAVGNRHWKEDTYQSFIFPGDTAQLSGTVGLDGLQDVLMDSRFDRTATVSRFELTNMDVGALADLGWEIDYPAALTCDLNSDGTCDVGDLDILIGQVAVDAAEIADRDRWLIDAAIENGLASSYLLGDVNLDGRVDAIDLNTVGKNWTQQASAWSQGDFDGSGNVDAIDLNMMGRNWQKTALSTNAANSISVVPEPATGDRWLLLLIATACEVTRRRRPT